MSILEKIKYHFSHERPAIHMHFDAFTYLDYNYIEDGVYIGTNQCCTEGLSELLRREKITADISLEADRLDAPFGVMSYTWIPTPDDNAPTLRQLMFGIDIIEHHVKNKERVYLHCHHGHGRSATFFAAYLIKTRKLSIDEALALVQKNRPSAKIHETQRAFLEKAYPYLLSPEVMA